MSASKSEDVLVNVENVKYRQKGPGKSPLGTLSVLKDRVEWKENGREEPLLSIPYSNIKSNFTPILQVYYSLCLVQRISPPNKDKIQLQICMHNDDQCTFVFMRPGANKEALIIDRDLIKETIQQALTRYRQVVHDVGSFLKDDLLTFICLDYCESRQRA